jgi:hypothetical protein
MTLAVRIISLVILVSVLGCEPDPACANVSTCRGETAGGTTKKDSDTNVHVSPWNVNVWPHHHDVRVQRHPRSLEP